MLLCVCVFGVVFLSVCIFKLVCLCVYSCTWVAVCFARVRCVCVGDFACWCVFVGQLYVCVFLCMCFCTCGSVCVCVFFEVCDFAYMRFCVYVFVGVRAFVRLSFCVYMFCVGDFACWCVFVGQLYVCVFLCMCFCTLHMLLISLMAFVYLMLFKSLMSVMPLM